MKKIRVAVIGVGSLGQKHAQIYRELEGVELAAVCDIQAERAQAIASSLQTTAASDFKAIGSQNLDAVSVCVPTSLHHQTARFFLSCGIHCLVEKPFTKTLAQADELIRLARKKSLILQVGHIERFNSAFQAIAPIVKNPKFIETHRLSLFPNRSLDVGAVLDIMIHDIDLLLGLVQSPVKSVDAVGAKVLTDFEDIANARIKFKNGCVANLTASRVSDETMRKIRIFFSDAYISLDYFTQEGSIYRKKGAGISKEQIPIEKEQPLKKELASFIECVRTGTKPLVSGIEARQALALALTIIKKINV